MLRVLLRRWRATPSLVRGFSTVKEVAHGFVTEKTATLPGSAARTAHFLRHTGHGLPHMHVHAPDPNVFVSIIVPHAIGSSTGIAQTTRRMVLSVPSAAYPVKDPLRALQARSARLQIGSYLGQDFSMYYFTSPSLSDIRNALDMHLNAVFLPLLRDPVAFGELGWRLEFEVPKDPSTPLQMKGRTFESALFAEFDSATVFEHAIRRAIFPKDSAFTTPLDGALSEVSKLTLGDVCDFHAKFYQPGNAKIFSYGKVDLDVLLALEDSFFQRLPRSADEPYIPAIVAHELPDPANLPPLPQAEGSERKLKAALETVTPSPLVHVPLPRQDTQSQKTNRQEDKLTPVMQALADAQKKSSDSVTTTGPQTSYDSVPSDEIDRAMRQKNMSKKDVDNFVASQKSEQEARASNGIVAGTAFRLNHCTDTYESLVLRLFCLLLVEGPDSPLTKTLVANPSESPEAARDPTNKSCLRASQLGPHTGFHSRGGCNYFCVSVSGVLEADLPRVDEYIGGTLTTISMAGFVPGRLLSCLHGLERHTVATLREDCGMRTLDRILPRWIYGLDPLEGFDISDHVERLKADLNARGNSVFQECFTKYFLRNPSRGHVVMQPSHGEYLRCIGAHNKFLETVQCGLKIGGAEETAIVQGADAARKRAATLPHGPEYAVIPHAAAHAPVPSPRPVFSSDGRVAVLEWDTNSMVHVYLKFDTDGLPERLSSVLPLYAKTFSMLPNTKNPLGKTIIDRNVFSTPLSPWAMSIPELTGGPEHTPTDAPRTAVIMNFSFAERSVAQGLDLVLEALQAPLGPPDTPLMRILLSQIATAFLGMLQADPVPPCAMHAAASLVPASILDDTFAGFSHFRNVTELLASSESTLFTAHERLAALHGALAARDRARVLVIAPPHSAAKVSDVLGAALADLPMSSVANKDPVRLPPPPQDWRQERTNLPRVFAGVPANRCVPAVVHSVRTPHFNTQEAAALQVAAQLLARVLEEVAQKRAGCVAGVRYTHHGLLNFSWRGDPNILGVLAIFKQAMRMLMEGDYSAQDLHQAVQQAVAAAELVKLPAQLALDEFVIGLTPELRDRAYQRLCATESYHLSEVSYNLFRKLDDDRVLTADEKPASSICAIGSKTDARFRDNPKWKWFTLVEEKPSRAD